MERKIGETFEFEGKTLQVKEIAHISCDGCFFDEQRIPCSKYVAGYCASKFRTDKKEVIFVEVKDEQPQEQAEQPQKLNLCEILKYCPQGETFWSPLLGDVRLHDINQERSFINIILENEETWNINADGTISFGTTTSPEIMLYPSREQRDWTKVKYEPKKERFDPKTLKPFDKVVVSNIQNNTWHIEYFSHIEERCKPYPFYCLADNFAYCIPYNDETKHLVGTTDEAPEFYRYWED